MTTFQLFGADSFLRDSACLAPWSKSPWQAAGHYYITTCKPPRRSWIKHDGGGVRIVTSFLFPISPSLEFLSASPQTCNVRTTSKSCARTTRLLGHLQPFPGHNRRNCREPNCILFLPRITRRSESAERPFRCQSNPRGHSGTEQ